MLVACNKNNVFHNNELKEGIFNLFQNINFILSAGISCVMSKAFDALDGTVLASVTGQLDRDDVLAFHIALEDDVPLKAGLTFGDPLTLGEPAERLSQSPRYLKGSAPYRTVLSSSAEKKKHPVFKAKLSSKGVFYDIKDGQVLYNPEGDFITRLISYLEKNMRLRDVRVESLVKKVKSTRIPQAVIHYTCEDRDGRKDGSIYIKEYGDKLNLARKDMALNLLCMELGLPCLRLLTDEHPEEFSNKYGLFCINGDMASLHTGQADLAEKIKTGAYSPFTLVETGCRVLKCLARIQVLITENLGKAEKYGLCLEYQPMTQVFKERFWQPFGLQTTSRSLSQLEEVITQRNGFVHGDMTAANVRLGINTGDITIYDFELARLGSSAEDEAMFALFGLSIAPFREAIKDDLYDAWSRAYLTAYNQVAHSKCTQSNYNRTVAIWQAVGHAMKIADQVWTQEEFGPSDERKHRAAWHLQEFSRLTGKDLVPELQRYSGLMHEFRREVLSLIIKSSKVAYLHASAKTFVRES